jgi:alpha-glucosidase (family GH31 glycosyl hydrolase)
MLKRTRSHITSAAALFLAFSVCCCACAAQLAAEKLPVGPLTAFEFAGDTLTLHCGSDVVIAQIVEPNILHVHYQPEGRTSSPTPVLDPNRTWRNDVPVKIDTSSDPITITTGHLTVKISRDPIRFAIYDAAKNLLLQERKEGGVYAHGLRFAYKASSPFFGIEGISLPHQNLDARQDVRAGTWRIGGSVRAGQQGDGGAPLAYTTSYGLLVDSDGGDFEGTEEALEFKGGSREDTEYFVIVGDPKAILRGVADISGHPPMMPKWTLGFMNSQWGTNEEEVTQLAETYRAKQVPIDGFILDFDWKAWGEDNYGEWRWNSTSGAGNVHPAMLEKGIKLAGIFKPRILLSDVNGTPTEAARYAAAHDLFLPGEQPYTDYFSERPCRDVDFAKPLARSWFWEHTVPAYKAGIQYFWNDEADSNEDNIFPNLQAMDMERAMYDGARSTENQRVWSLNRNFYLGAQRYAYAEWSGDVGTGFDSMAWQAPRMLATIDLGEPHWSMDTGGFGGHPTSENYARWVEFSAFVPIMRVHGTLNEHRQPWLYGSQAEADAKAAIELRYRLIPYIYSYEHEAHETGLGIVRPLFWDFPDDSPHTAYITDEWMFGDEFLVAPIFHEGQAHRSVYLPAGEWIDYSRGQRYRGPTTLVYDVNPQTWADIPLFVRGGSIIPSQEIQQYVGEHPVTQINLDVFPAATEASFVYYDDDGISYDYEKNNSYLQRLTAMDDGKVVRFDALKPNGTFKPALRNYDIKIHGAHARTVTLDGTPCRHFADILELEGQAGEGWTTGTDQYGDFVFVKIAAQAEKHIVAM